MSIFWTDPELAKFWAGLIGAILGTLGSAITFRIPVRALFGCTITGMLGWEVCYFMSSFGIVPVYCNFMAAITISLCSESLARSLRMPATVFVVPGILPLVPGTLTYDSMLSIIRGDSDQATAAGMKAMLIASGIAVGMLMGTAISRGFIDPSLQNLHDSLKDDFAISIPELVDADPPLASGQPIMQTRRRQRQQNRRNKYQRLRGKQRPKKNT